MPSPRQAFSREIRAKLLSVTPTASPTDIKVIIESALRDASIRGIKMNPSLLLRAITDVNPDAKIGKNSICNIMLGLGIKPELTPIGERGRGPKKLSKNFPLYDRLGSQSHKRGLIRKFRR